jgi:hypothetical protein
MRWIAGARRDARQRQLDQDAVDLRVGVELVDQVEQLGLGGTGRQVVVMRLDADLLGGTALVAHVHGRGRVAADQHHGQARAAATGGHAGVDAHLQAVEQVLGDAAAIKDAGRMLGAESVIGGRRGAAGTLLSLIQAPRPPQDGVLAGVGSLCHRQGLLTPHVAGQAPRWNGSEPANVILPLPARPAGSTSCLPASAR